MTDLFAPGTAPSSPNPHARPAPKSTAWRVDTGKGVASGLVHPCGVCGAAVAPFGSGVSLRRAIATGSGRAAGTWVCGACREGVT